VPLAPEERVDVPLPEAFDCRGHLALEGEAPHLAVRHHIEPGLLLEREGRVDRFVLCLLEGGLRERARLELLPRLEQERRPEEAADDIGTSQEHMVTLDPYGYDSRFAPRRGSRA
jgi:hypothetical protein